MSIERCPRALAFFFFSAIVAGVALGEVPAHRARAVEQEAALASTREVYLVVGVESGTLEIRVRGVTLETFAPAFVTAHEQRRFATSGDTERLEIPKVFVTAATISLVDRRVVAPDVLRPWSDEAETGRPLTKDDARPVPPSEYDVPLEGGWILEIRQNTDDLSGYGRLEVAIADGWAHLVGRGDRDRRPTIRLTIDEAAARKIHHLFKKGTAILLVPDIAFRD